MREIKQIVRRVIQEEFNYFSENRHFPKIGLSTEDVFPMIEYSDSHKNLFPDFDEFDSEYYDDFYFESREEAYQEVNEILSTFEDMSDPIEIFRTIKVDDLDSIRYDDLGESWSFERTGAIQFANNHGRGNVLLIGKVKFEDVDWKKTLQLYFQFSYRQYLDAENEIYVSWGGNVFDVRAEKI